MRLWLRLLTITVPATTGDVQSQEGLLRSSGSELIRKPSHPFRRRAAPRAAANRCGPFSGEADIAIVSDPKQAAMRRGAATGEPAPYKKTRELSDPAQVAVFRCKPDGPPADPAAPTE